MNNSLNYSSICRVYQIATKATIFLLNVIKWIGLCSVILLFCFGQFIVIAAKFSSSISDSQAVLQAAVKPILNRSNTEPTTDSSLHLFFVANTKGQFWPIQQYSQRSVLAIANLQQSLQLDNDWWLDIGNNQIDYQLWDLGTEVPAIKQFLTDFADTFAYKVFDSSDIKRNLLASLSTIEQILSQYSPPSYILHHPDYELQIDFFISSQVNLPIIPWQNKISTFRPYMAINNNVKPWYCFLISAFGKYNILPTLADFNLSTDNLSCKDNQGFAKGDQALPIIKILVAETDLEVINDGFLGWGVNFDKGLWQMIDEFPDYDLYIATKAFKHFPTSGKLAFYHGKPYFAIGTNDERILELKLEPATANKRFLNQNIAKFSASYAWHLPSTNYSASIKNIEKIMHDSLVAELNWQVIAKRYSANDFRNCLQALSIAFIENYNSNQEPAAKIRMMFGWPWQFINLNFAQQVSTLNIKQLLPDNPLFFSLHLSPLQLDRLQSKYAQLDYKTSDWMWFDNNSQLVMVSAQQLATQKQLQFLRLFSENWSVLPTLNWRDWFIDYMNTQQPPAACIKIFKRQVIAQ